MFLFRHQGKIRCLRLQKRITVCHVVKNYFYCRKTAFQQRRKTLRNSLKTLNLSDALREDEIFNLRPEQLNVEQFALTQKIEADGV
jgi:16S rRNA (adenine1518-N6/adenine1519-N6)-dimethyltransferase